MKNDDGFLTDDGLTDEDAQVLRNLHKRDPVTGRKAKRANPLNSEKLTKRKLDEFMLEQVELDF